MNSMPQPISGFEVLYRSWWGVPNEGTLPRSGTPSPDPDLPGRNRAKQKAESLIEPIKRGILSLSACTCVDTYSPDEDDIHAEFLQCPGNLRMGCLCGVLDAEWGITRLSGVFLSENVAIEQGVGPPGAAPSGRNWQANRQPSFAQPS